MVGSVLSGGRGGGGERSGFETIKLKIVQIVIIIINAFKKPLGGEGGWFC